MSPPVQAHSQMISMFASLPPVLPRVFQQSSDDVQPPEQIADFSSFCWARLLAQDGTHGYDPPLGITASVPIVTDPYLTLGAQKQRTSFSQAIASRDG